MNIYISLAIILIYSSCEFALKPNIRVTTRGFGIDNSGANGVATLLTAAHTRKPTSTIQLTCGLGIGYYLNSPTIPTSDDIGWAACPSPLFTINETLSSGDNNFSYWFKSTTGEVSSTSNDIYVKSGKVTITSPDPVMNGYFSAQDVLELSPTRFVVTDSLNSSVANKAGAVHVYDNFGSLVQSIYGQNANDNFGGDAKNALDSGRGKVIKLSGGRFAVEVNSYDGPLGTTTNSGGVFFYDQNGTELFSYIGEDANDRTGTVTELSNGNFVVCSSYDVVGGIASAGSAILLRGTDGVVLGSVSGLVAGDRVCSGGIQELGNGLFVVKSPLQDTVGGVDAGTVKVLNASTGDVAWSFEGDDPGDTIGVNFTELTNGNIVIAVPLDNVDPGNISDAGSVYLLNGLTGAIINTISGMIANDQVGAITRDLKNGHFVIASRNADVGLTANAGVVHLVNGNSGAIIKIIEGTYAGDGFGTQVIEAPGGNFVIGSPSEDTGVAGAITDGGSWRLYNGMTGDEITEITCPTANDGCGSYGISLSNGNFVLGDRSFDAAGKVDAGRILLLNGSTGAVMNTVVGDTASDQLGDTIKFLELASGVVAIASRNVDVGGSLNHGSVIMINGTTSAVIATHYGAGPDDFMNVHMFGLPNGNLVISAPYAGATDIGNVILVNGVTGATLATLIGDDPNDRRGHTGSALTLGDRFVTSSWYDTISGVSNAGSMLLVNSQTGAIDDAYYGSASFEAVGSSNVSKVYELSNGNVIYTSSKRTVGGLTVAGELQISPLD